MTSRTPRLVPAASLAAASLALAACGADEPAPSSSTNPPPVVTEPTTDASPSEEPSASPSTDAPTAAPETTDASAFGPAGTAQGGEPSGDALLPVDVRVGDHEGFDRVVVQLAGEGVPGWQVEYVDEAVEDGRGERVDVDGEAILSVHVSGTRYPEEGEAHYVPDGPLPGLDAVEEVHYLGTFEGLTQLFIGIDDGPADYRVLTLTDPARLVIDIADPED
jgi:hypothetical protein